MDAQRSILLAQAVVNSHIRVDHKEPEPVRVARGATLRLRLGYELTGKHHHGACRFGLATSINGGEEQHFDYTHMDPRFFDDHELGNVHGDLTFGDPGRHQVSYRIQIERLEGDGQAPMHPDQERILEGVLDIDVI